MFPSHLHAAVQQANQAEVERGLEAARHRAAHAAARRERGRARLARTRLPGPGLRTDSQVNARPA
jgi:hypothetical protein